MRKSSGSPALKYVDPPAIADQVQAGAKRGDADQRAELAAPRVADDAWHPAGLGDEQADPEQLLDLGDVVAAE